MMRRIITLLMLTVITLDTGCARLTAQEPMAFWADAMGRESVRSPLADMAARGALSGGGTVGVAGGLFLDEFERKWAP
jgi:hypothetical protein